MTFDKLVLLHLKGGGIQIISAVLMIVQNIAAPYFVGAEGFGKAVFLLSFVFLFQGILEPIFHSLVIQSVERNNGQQIYLGRLVCDGLFFLALYLIAVYSILHAVSFNDFFSFLACLLILYFVGTLCYALAYALQLLKMIFFANVIALILFTLTLWFFREEGEHALIFANIVHQSCAILVLGSDRRLQKFLIGRALFGKNDLSQYLAALLTRASYLILGSGLTIYYGFVSDFYSLAVFKIFVSMVNAGRYLVPISTPVLQASIVGGSHGKLIGKTFAILGFAFAAWSLVALVEFFISPLIISSVLELQRTPDDKLYWVFVAMPFYLSMQPLSVVVFATGKVEIIKHCFVAFSVVVVLALIAVEVPVTFLLGSYAYVFFMLIMVAKIFLQKDTLKTS